MDGNFNGNNNNFGGTENNPYMPQDGMQQQAFDQQPYGQSAYGQQPYGQQPMGGQSYSSMPTGTPQFMGDLEEPVSLGDWIVCYLLMCVPCVNLIMLFIWAFGSGHKKSKANWAKAQLIVMGVFILLYFVFIGVIVGVAGGMAEFMDAVYSH